MFLIGHLDFYSVSEILKDYIESNLNIKTREPGLPTDKADRHFVGLDHSIREREHQKIRSAKCKNCGRVTLYRLKDVKGRRLVCKSCKKPITLTRL